MRMGLLAVFVLWPGLVLANPYRDSLTEAAESLEDALSAARRSGGSCTASLSGGLRKGIDDVDSIRRGTSEQRFSEIQLAVDGLAATSPRASCKQKVTDRIGRAVLALNRARALLSGYEDRRERRHRRDDDEEGPPPAGHRMAEASMGALRVTYDQLFEGEPAVRVDVTSVALRGLGQQRFYFGGRFRPQGGPLSAWYTSPELTASRDPYLANDLYTFWFKLGALRAADTANGRFMVKVSLFDANRAELTSQEVPLEVRFAPAGPPPPPVARDCGTGPDAGCMMQRQGQYPMDRDVFSPFFDSLRRVNSDLTRADMCKSVFAANWLTAKQLGMILELFISDLVRLDVAKLAAPHTVNPQHALGLTSKFRSSLLQRDFTQLMSGQR